MFSLAEFRYRNVLARDGGPVDSIESRTVPVFGRPMVQVNAWLSVGLVQRGNYAMFGNASGTGTHRLPKIARRLAVSQALEGWAFNSSVTSSRASEFGFDIDPSSNGISAYPGILGRNARRKAMLEAIERFSLIAWWEGQARWRLFDTDWPGVSAVAIDGPFGGVTVIAYSRTDNGMFAYGHAAEESFGAACEQAVIKLARNERTLHAWWLASIIGERRNPSNIFERRCLYFSTEEGHESFQQRIRDDVHANMPQAAVVCDRDIPGPWADYATVWRFVLQPPSDGYLRAGDDYFFW